MKKIFILFFLTSFFGGYGQKEINFIQDDYQNALKVAATSNKTIMIDAYTTWCGPCKMMSNNTFKDEETADFYNQNFINLKLDMEKNNGPALGVKYNVKAYPTIVFIDSKENIVYKSVGYIDGPTFLALGKDVIGGKKNIFSLMNAYSKGGKTSEKLLELVKAKVSMMEPDASKYAAEYLKTQKDWTTQTNQELIIQTCNDVESKMFEYVIANIEKYKKSYGEPTINRLIESAVQNYVNRNPLPKLKNVEKVFKMVYPNEYKQTTGKYQMGITRSKGDIKGYTKAALSYFKTYDKDSEELNEAAITFYKVVDKPKYLMTATEWAEKAIKIDNTIDNINTLAALFIKLNQKDKAKKALDSSFLKSTRDKIENPFADELLILLKNIEKK